MAVKAFRTLTLILLLFLSVVTATSTVMVAPVVAASGSGGGTCGDPDSPKDTGPRTAAAQSSSSSNYSQIATLSVSPVGNSRQAVRWMLVEQLLSSLLGRPGLMR
jgi:hypothetical protein